MWLSLWSIQAYKITSTFGQNLTIRTAHDTFLESRHPDVTKNVCYGCPQARAKCPFFWLLAHGLFALITILLLHSATF